MKLEELKLKKALEQAEEEQEKANAQMVTSVTNAEIDTSAKWERQPLFVRQTFYTPVF